MKQQKLIVRYNPTTFEKEVNGYLEQGWRIVPQSTNVSVACGYNKHGYAGTVETKYICAIVLERD